MNKTLLYGLLAVLVTAGVVLFFMVFMDIVGEMGHNIPQEDLHIDYLFGLTWAMFLGLSIIAWPVAARDKRNLMWAWSAKCLVTLGFMLIYENHYRLDSIGVFTNAVDPYYVWDMFRFGNGTDNVVRLAWLHNSIFPDSYHMVKVSFSLIGFIALYIIYRAGVLFVEREDPRVFFAMMLFPTNIFWSSIIGKDPTILFGIAVYIYGVAGWYRTNRFRYIFLIFLGILETTFIRIWISVILIAPLSVFFIGRMRSQLTRIVFIILVLAGFSWSAQRFQNRFKIETRADILEKSEFIAQSWATGGSGQVRELNFDEPTDLLTFLPLGMSTALLRPLPGEVRNLFGLLASLENVTFILILLLAAFRTRWYELFDVRVMWAISLLLAWASMYAFASYQNLGTAARFKMQIMPVFLGLAMYLSRRRSSGPGLPPPGR